MTSDVARIATSTCDKLLAKKDTFGDQCDAVRAELTNFAKTCSKLDVSDGAKKKAFDQMIKAMSSTLETTHAIEAFVKALEKVRNDARRGVFDNAGDAFPDEFRKALDAAVESYGEPDIDDEPPLKKLREAAGFEKADDEDEDVVLDDTHDTSEAALTCPISTGLLVQPMKARPCGHVYSAASAKAYFKGQGKKCAVFGCDKHLKWSDFVKDKASEIALREARKRRERTQRSQAEEIDDEDDE
jgi:hypothetical protein